MEKTNWCSQRSTFLRRILGALGTEVAPGFLGKNQRKRSLCLFFGGLFFVIPKRLYDIYILIYIYMIFTYTFWVVFWVVNVDKYTIPSSVWDWMFFSFGKVAGRYTPDSHS